MLDVYKRQGGADGAQTHTKTSTQSTSSFYDKLFHCSFPPNPNNVKIIVVIFNRLCDLNLRQDAHTSQAFSGGGQALPT